MSDAGADARVVRVLTGLLRAGRVLDEASFGTLVGALMVEIEAGLDLAEERALEASHRRPRGDVFRFRPRERGKGPSPGERNEGRIGFYANPIHSASSPEWLDPPALP